MSTRTTPTVEAVRTPDHGAEYRLLRVVAWSVFAIGALADLVTTGVGLQLGLVESNPIARAVLGMGAMAGAIGAVALKAAVVPLILAAAWLVRERYGMPRAALVIPAWIGVNWALAAAYNAHLIGAVLAA